MASVFVCQFHVEYSIVDGRIKEFSEQKDGKFEPVIEDYDKKLDSVKAFIRNCEQFQEHGFPAFMMEAVNG